jgi:hypothetical protein
MPTGITSLFAHRLERQPHDPSRRDGLSRSVSSKRLVSRFPMKIFFFGMVSLAAGLPVAASAQIQNSYRPMVTAPPGPQDPAHFDMADPGVPAITPPSFYNGNGNTAASGVGTPSMEPLAPSAMPFPPPGTPGGFQSSASG